VNEVLRLKRDWVGTSRAVLVNIVMEHVSSSKSALQCFSGELKQSILGCQLEGDITVDCEAVDSRQQRLSADRFAAHSIKPVIESVPDGSALNAEPRSVEDPIASSVRLGKAHFHDMRAPVMLSSSL
jgi:hypothetical protein